jgi:hypothetical protein
VNEFLDGGSPRYFVIDGVLIDCENPTPEAIEVVRKFILTDPTPINESQ